MDAAPERFLDVRSALFRRGAYEENVGGREKPGERRLRAMEKQAAAALSVPISFASAESVTTPIRYWPKVS